MPEFYGAAAFFEQPTGGSADGPSAPPMRPPIGSVFQVRNAESLDPLPDGATTGDGYWHYSIDDPGVRAIQVSGDGTDWSEVFFDQQFLLDRVTAPVIIGDADTTPATNLQDGTVGWGSTPTGTRVLRVAQGGQWVTYAEGITTSSIQDLDAVILAQAKAYTEARIAAIVGGTTTGTGGTQPVDTSGNTPATLTYQTVYTTSFDNATGWEFPTAGSTIAGGQLVVSGAWKAGAAQVIIRNGVVPGRRVKVTYTIAPGSTGEMYPLIDCVVDTGAGWQWVEPVDPDPADPATTFSTSFTASLIIPENVNLLTVGARCAGGTTVVTDMRVEISTTIAPVSVAPPAVGSKVLPIPLNDQNFAEKDISAYPVDPNSAGFVKALTDEVASLANGAGNVAANIYQFSTNLWIVDNSTPRMNWRYNNVFNWSWTPQGMNDGIMYLQNVPTPPNLTISGGTDKAVAIYNRDTNQLWEFWVAEKDANGVWGAQQGYRIDNVTSWLGTYPVIGTGVSGSGLTHTATNITAADVAAGKIMHAMCLEITNNRVAGRTDSYAFPAVRNTDGGATGTYAIPYGARFRIKAGAVMPSGLHPIAQIIWQAAKKYGFVMAEKTGWVAVAFDGGLQEQARTGVDPWLPLLNGSQPYEVFAGFPWQDLEMTLLGYKG